MGHAFQQTLMDALIRYHRMRGDNTNWVAGTDHAGIATQIVVERQLQDEGQDAPRPRSREIRRARLGVEAAIRLHHHAPDAPPGRLLQLGLRRRRGQKAGYFTMDAPMSRAVVEVFVRLHEEGLIYRGKRLVNWDPQLGTAVSDLEVDSEEENGKIWEIRYPVEDGSSSSVVATTRPETMLGDVAVAVNPKDERYAAFVGKQVALPLTGRKIPVIADDYVDPEFGTGCVKITPAHDFNDYAVGAAAQAADDRDPDAGREDHRRHRLLTAWTALTRARRSLRICRSRNLLVSEKPYKLRVPRSGRTGVIVEPMLTDQWFVKMDGMAKRGLEAVAERRREVLPRALDLDLQPLAGEHPGLVHLAPALVGPPDPGLVRRRGKCLRRAHGRGSAAQKRKGHKAKLQARRRRARHLVLLAAGAVHLARLAGEDAGPRDATCPPRCWSPATTSSSSGSRA